MRAVSCYIVNDRIGMQSILKEVSCRYILASNKVQRYRLITLFFLLASLVRLPHMSCFEWALWKRWYGHIEPSRFKEMLQLRGRRITAPISRGNP